MIYYSLIPFFPLLFFPDIPQILVFFGGWGFLLFFLVVGGIFSVLGLFWVWFFFRGEWGYLSGFFSDLVG